MSVDPKQSGEGEIARLVAERSVLVCCGSGGVGKTTVSASIAVEGARRGRRVCVVTIDPARRLADSLGVQALANTPVAIDGPWPGSLDAVMLDPKGTFDDLIRRHAATPEQADAILANRIYRNLTGALSGTQEYMAMEKLHELVDRGGYDLLVVDTPPTRNALDFLDAPGRLTRLLGNRIFQLLLTPTRAYLRAVSVATQGLLRAISKVAGGELVQDAVTFFQAFEGMEEGFRHRAEEVRRMLAQPDTGFLLVTSPRSDSLTEASWFADRLEHAGLRVDGLVVNRIHPAFPAPEPLPDAPEASALAALVENLRSHQRNNADDEARVGQLARRLAPAPLGRIPLLAEDVHDVAGLVTVAHSLFDATGTSDEVPAPSRPAPSTPPAG